MWDVSIRGYTGCRLPSRVAALEAAGDLRIRVAEQLKVLTEVVLIQCRSMRWGLRKPCLLVIRGERREERRGNGCR